MLNLTISNLTFTVWITKFYILWSVFFFSSLLEFGSPSLVEFYGHGRDLVVFLQSRGMRLVSEMVVD